MKATDIILATSKQRGKQTADAIKTHHDIQAGNRGAISRKRKNPFRGQLGINVGGKHV